MRQVAPIALMSLLLGDRRRGLPDRRAGKGDEVDADLTPGHGERLVQSLGAALIIEDGAGFGGEDADVVAHSLSRLHGPVTNTARSELGQFRLNPALDTSAHPNRPGRPGGGTTAKPEQALEHLDPTLYRIVREQFDLLAGLVR